jgi:hypothetical protein
MRVALLRSLVALLIVIIAVPLVPPDTIAQAQTAGCLPSRNLAADIGEPGQDGTTIEGQFAQVSDQGNWLFHLTSPRSVYVYVGDQWYDLDLAILSLAEDKVVACWRVKKEEAISARTQRRIIQLIRPDDRILELLPPGDYLLLVRPAFDDIAFVPDFDPGKKFTVRLATAPIACAVNPPNDEVDPQYPQLKRRRADEQNLYQLSVSYQPVQPGPFDLLTFNAVVSPPFTDLFDFEWQIDGQPVPDSNQPTIQAPVPALAQLPAGAQHQVSVTARGAREYPDPDQPSIPPTLTAGCSFQLKS